MSQDVPDRPSVSEQDRSGSRTASACSVHIGLMASGRPELHMTKKNSNTFVQMVAFLLVLSP